MKQIDQVLHTLEAKRMTRGAVEINQEVGKAKNVTGAKFDEIG
jgi:hypothetical protein